MKKAYLYVSNGSKPSAEEFELTTPVGPNSFSKASIWAANEMGWDLHMGINRKFPEKIQSLDFEIQFYNQNSFRNVFAIKDICIAYNNLCLYLKENPQIEIIHCNTPIGGLVGRLAGKKFNKKVIYMAHGFHFYKGAPIINRTIFKWIEQYLAHYTDILITINKEDFQAARQFKLKKDGKVFYVPGVGIDLEHFMNLSFDKESKRKNVGLSSNDFVIISIGNLNDNKNTSTLIKALNETPYNCHYLICGTGPKEQELKNLAKEYKIESRCHFLGHRKDINELLAISDIYVMASKREGLPRSTMEAMASGLPCIVSSIRGNQDLIENGMGGFLISPDDSYGFAKAINTLRDNRTLMERMSSWNLKRIKEFDINFVKSSMLNIFKLFQR